MRCWRRVNWFRGIVWFIYCFCYIESVTMEDYHGQENTVQVPSISTVSHYIEFENFLIELPTT